MELDIRPLLAGERSLSFAYDLAAPDVSDPGSFLYGVRFAAPMKVEGKILNTAGYMQLSLSLVADYQTACARCLAPVEGRFTMDLTKTVATKEMLKNLDEEKQDEYAIAEDGFLDLDEQLYLQLEMEFPSRFLCKEDCLGLCPKCGKNLNEGKCSCPEKEADPRLSVLGDLLVKLREDESNTEKNN